MTAVDILSGGSGANNRVGFWTKAEVAEELYRPSDLYMDTSRAYYGGYFIEGSSGSFSDMFRLEDILKDTEVTPGVSGAGWDYTSSVFSGWGGAIGSARDFNTLTFRLRNRSSNTGAITKIRVIVRKTDFTGTTLADRTILDYSIAPGTDQTVRFPLGATIANPNGDKLWAFFLTDQKIDVWMGSADVSLNSPDYGATYYAINGVIDDGSTMSAISDPGRTNRKKPWFATTRMGKVYRPTQPLLDMLPEPVRVILPACLDAIPGDTLQLFYRGMVEAADPYAFDIKVRYDGEHGQVFPRYFQLNPTAADVGEHTLTVTVLNNRSIVLGEGTTRIRVKSAPASPAAQTNILCIGDSLTAGGAWVTETQRRLCGTGGAPAGLGLAKVGFVGTQGSSPAKYEGYGGWSWNSYIASGSPFWNTSTAKLDVADYCARNAIAKIDAVFLLLGWNGMDSYRTAPEQHTGLIADARVLIRAFHSAYPAAKVRIMGLQLPSLNGGLGANYSANSVYSDRYGMIRSVMGLNLSYQKLTEEAEFAPYTEFVSLSVQFDSENCMPEAAVSVNLRCVKTELRGTNGVHPSNDGYMQIADAAYRSIAASVL